MKIIDILKDRFYENMNRHPEINWDNLHKSLSDNTKVLAVLEAMEESGGEPDVVGCTDEGQYVFFDCSPESPKDRRSLCYDKKAWESRKKHKPNSSAEEDAEAMGIELLTEEEYRELQQIGEFDLKTSSWLKTENDIRDKGGAIFGDRRFGRVFIYHNGAESYYSARGYRGKLLV